MEREHASQKRRGPVKEILGSLPAKFVSFEGIDGCGKSTVLGELASWLEANSVRLLKTREPGGTHLGERVRGVLLDPSFDSMYERAEVLLYSASRAQLVHEVIRPALSMEMWVLADRYIDATLAYQGFGRGLALGPLRQLQDWATGGLWPDLTILLDCDIIVASSRMKARNEGGDRMEQESRLFHQKVRDGYLELARSASDRFVVVDAGGPLQDVIEEARTALVDALTG